MDMSESPEKRGRGARHPHQVPVRGWKDIAFRVKDELAQDNIGIVAAGVAFYAMLAVFPALAAMVSVFGLVVDPIELERNFNQIAILLPEEGAAILHQELKRIVSAKDSKLGLGALIGFLLTLWSSTKGVKALFTALNIVYEEREERGFIKLNLMAIGFTCGGILLVMVLLAAVAGIPIVVEALNLDGIIGWTISIARWPLVALIVVAAMAVIFRFGPSRRNPRWHWVSWGAAGGTILWIVGSMAFSWYVADFGSYNKTYGSLGAVVILLMWFYLTAYIVLLSAEVNAELEHQTARDTTTGPPRPLGERGATMADTIGKAHHE